MTLGDHHVTSSLMTFT